MTRVVMPHIFNMFILQTNVNLSQDGVNFLRERARGVQARPVHNNDRC